MPGPLGGTSIYPNTAADPSALLGGIFAGGLIFLLIYLVIVFIAGYIAYRIIKAAVRDGVTDALKRNGVADALSKGTPYVQGYPPAQPYSTAVPAAQPPYTGQSR